MEDTDSYSDSGAGYSKKVNIRTLSLIICTISYLMFGAAVFDTIESEHEERQRIVLQIREQRLAEKYNMSHEDRAEMERLYVQLVPYRSGIQWKFTGAFYFVLTVITTIGYGHAAPQTVPGKMFCMAYAFLGIPLSLTVYQAVGERLNTFMAFWLGAVKRRLVQKSEGRVTQTELVMAGWTACSIVLFGGAGIFSHFERWDYFDSLYYCYITLTTIGFGDYVALQSKGALQREPKYVFLSILYIMIALCVVASSINLLVLRFLTMNTMEEKTSADMERIRHFEHELNRAATRNSVHHNNPPPPQPPVEDLAAAAPVPANHVNHANHVSEL